MADSEVHHQREGVLASWGHACGHLSNPIPYESREAAEAARAGMEAQPCWECRNLQPTPSVAPLSPSR